MGSKKMLFLGISMLIIGILVRKLSSFEMSGLVMIVTGVICKTVYIIAKVKTGEYRPGKELLFLGFGLLLFLSGLYLRKSDQNLTYPLYLIFVGLILKVIFIIKFIRIVKKNRADPSVISN